MKLASPNAGSNRVRCGGTPIVPRRVPSARKRNSPMRSNALALSSQTDRLGVATTNFSLAPDGFIDANAAFNHLIGSHTGFTNGNCGGTPKLFAKSLVFNQLFQQNGKLGVI